MAFKRSGVRSSLAPPIQKSLGFNPRLFLYHAYFVKYLDRKIDLNYFTFHNYFFGAIAQLGERLVRNQ